VAKISTSHLWLIVSVHSTTLSKKIYESIEDTTTAETDNSPVCFPVITHCKEFGSAVYRYHIHKMYDDVIHEKKIISEICSKVYVFSVS